ncbi:MAG: hypothetical protein Ct9H300mP29_6000 [Candidatus Neomarinimicrobiota bacterium]|nr:MAG: hypothetical protein Ct9H300mP29_6000 [Candidatus Neomarinimicrobiota bacterium]
MKMVMGLQPVIGVMRNRYPMEGESCTSRSPDKGYSDWYEDYFLRVAKVEKGLWNSLNYCFRWGPEVMLLRFVGRN